MLVIVYNSAALKLRARWCASSKKLKIHHNNCRFNRPYDDQSFLTIKLESEAKLFVQKEIIRGTFELIWSYVMDYENSANPYVERRNAIARWHLLAKADIGYSEK